MRAFAPSTGRESPAPTGKRPLKPSNASRRDAPVPEGTESLAPGPRGALDFSRLPLTPPPAAPPVTPNSGSAVGPTGAANRAPGRAHEPDRTASTLPTQEAPLQRKCAKCEEAPPALPTHGALLQRKCAKCEDEEARVLQRKARSGGEVGAIPPIVGEVLRSGGQPLDAALRADFEPAFGHDFSHVRVHADGRADASARAVDALAYTVGRDIVFRAGNYAPHTTSGRRLLAHELTHVVQQAHAGGANVSPKRVVDSQDASEREADRVAEQVVAGRGVHRGPAPLARLPSIGGAPAVLQRQPALGVTVPEVTDPTTVAALKTDHEYQWQNPILRATIYPEREASLRQFLYLQQEMDPRRKSPLTDEEKQEVEAALGDVQQQLDQARTDLQDTKSSISTNESRQRDAQRELTTAKARKQDVLNKDPEARSVHQERVDLQKQLARQEADIAAANTNLDWVEKTKKRIGTKEYEQQRGFWAAKRQGVLERKQAVDEKQTAHQAKYDQLLGPLETPIARLTQELADLKEENKRLNAALKTTNAAITSLTAELQNLNQVKSGKAPAIAQWRLRRYTRKIEAMDHDQLVQAVQELFDGPDGARFSADRRYAVMHLSGMRYASAHNSWYSTQQLLQGLKSREIKDASPEARQGYMARGQALLDAPGLKLTSDERRTLADTEGTALAQRIKKLKKIESASTPAERQDVIDRSGKLYAEIQKLDTQIQAHYLELQHQGGDPTKASSVMQAITALKTTLAAREAELDPSVVTLVQDARKRRQDLLVAIYEKNARAKLGQLEDMQALGLLQEMRDAGQIPDAVWKELELFTQLRLNTTDPAWESARKQQGLKGVVGATPEETAKLAIWRNLLLSDLYKGVSSGGGFKGATLWRPEQGKTLSPSLTTSLVCDQLGSSMQAVRGHDRPGGLRGNARYYEKLQEQGAPGAFFKRPKSVADLPPGASIYWVTWSSMPIEKSYRDKWTEVQQQEQTVKSLEAALERLRSKPQTTSTDAARKELAKRQDEFDKKKAALKESEANLAKMRIYNPETASLPDISQLVSPMGPVGGNLRFEDLATVPLPEDKEATKHKWEYRVQVQDIRGTRITTIMRAVLNPHDCANGGCTLEFTTTPNRQVIKQWLTFQHEATVVSSDESVTITFDTSTQFKGKEVKALGERKRNTQDLLDKAHILVGFAPEMSPKKSSSANTSDALKKKSPGGP
ncbi:DUF4157 domain-containing protein [Myxococcus stipitatus]|uniref:eCIS core domain-containing protein n=1 Tax=Myxococcus stipitatus TaxID=83455 RepID=UPI001F318C1B|nr:DUF4157 domain-containing protein [Myxococcus stipitatus]MCE9672833.1 DUF4157 domain-containing protein [Myxococcus stipitatus]